MTSPGHLSGNSESTLQASDNRFSKQLYLRAAPQALL